MPSDFSVQEQCPHCPGGSGLKYPLYEDQDFWLVADAHPLVEGHTLLIPKKHLPCFGAFAERSLPRIQKIYDLAKSYLSQLYPAPQKITTGKNLKAMDVNSGCGAGGPVAVFEHGVTGQTVFHAHMHFLPFKGIIEDLIPEIDYLIKIKILKDLILEFTVLGRYMYTELNDHKWLVEPSLGFPTFFRQRYAKALGVPERADWREASQDKKLVKQMEKDVKRLQKKWKRIAGDQWSANRNFNYVCYYDT